MFKKIDEILLLVISPHTYQGRCEVQKNTLPNLAVIGPVCAGAPNGENAPRESRTSGGAEGLKSGNLAISIRWTQRLEAAYRCFFRFSAAGLSWR